MKAWPGLQHVQESLVFSGWGLAETGEGKLRWNSKIANYLARLSDGLGLEMFVAFEFFSILDILFFVHFARQHQVKEQDQRNKMVEVPCAIALPSRLDPRLFRILMRARLSSMPNGSESSAQKIYQGCEVSKVSSPGLIQGCILTQITSLCFPRSFLWVFALLSCLPKSWVEAHQLGAAWRARGSYRVRMS